MNHPIHRVESFAIVAPHTIRVCFEDGSHQTIEFRPVLEGELFGPLQELSLFEKVSLDPEAHTLVWPNGADFDPATLYDWPTHRERLIADAQRWALASTRR